MNDLMSFPDQTRVWIYAANKIIPPTQAEKIHEAVYDFAKHWSSHHQAVEATGGFMHGVFIVLMVNEQINKPGGCSIDGSVQFIRKLGQQFDVDFLDRQILYYIMDNQVHVLPLSQLNEAYQSGKINSETLFIDTLVQDSASFKKAWLKTLKVAWQRRLLEGEVGI